MPRNFITRCLRGKAFAMQNTAVTCKLVLCAWWASQGQNVEKELRPPFLGDGRRLGSGLSRRKIWNPI